MIPLTIHRTDNDGYEYPILVWVEYMVEDNRAYGLIAWDEGDAINLTPAEENEALERIYSEMPSVSNYELY